MTRDRSPHSGTNPARDDADPEDTFTLDELCALGGVTVRTVRYYISEGLLPPPSGHGATARYRRAHLDRLVVIGMMKERFLPLREIRRALDRMTGAQIADTAGVIRQPQDEEETPLEDAVASGPLPSVRETFSMMAPPPMALREEPNASDYIADVLDRDPRRQRQAPGQRPHFLPAREPEAGSWKRIVISDEAELLIEEDAYHRRREQIESLVAWAKRILNGT